MPSKEEKTFLKFWLPAVVWMSVIFLFSSYPTASTSEIYWQDFFIKKLAHIVEYGILATLLYRALKNQKIEKKKAGFLAIFFSMLYGLSDEFHQSFTPGRDPKLRDAIFDTIGASLAIYSIWKLFPKAPKKLRVLAEKWQLM